MNEPSEQVEPRLLEALQGLAEGRRDPVLREAGRDSLLRAVSAQRLRPGRRRRLWVLGAVAAAAAALILTVTVSAGAQPDSPLYGVRRADESLRLVLTFTSEARGRLHLDYALDRAGEAGAMAAASHPDLAAKAAAEADADIKAAVAAFGSGATSAERELVSRDETEVVTRLRMAADALRLRGLGSAATMIRGSADSVSQQTPSQSSPGPTPAPVSTPSPTPCPVASPSPTLSAASRGPAVSSPLAAAGSLGPTPQASGSPIPASSECGSR